MSDYMMHQPTPPKSPRIEDLDNEGTLFADDMESDRYRAIEKMVDQGGMSYHEARRLLGEDMREEEKPATIITPEGGVATSLDERAEALRAIMAYYNKANGTAGLKTETGTREAAERYDDVEDVQRGATFNRDSLENGYRLGVKKLMATEALKGAGFSPAEILVAQVPMKDHDKDNEAWRIGASQALAGALTDTVQDRNAQKMFHAQLNAHYGVGKAKAAERNKVVDRAQNAADVGNGRKVARKLPQPRKNRAA